MYTNALTHLFRPACPLLHGYILCDGEKSNHDRLVKVVQLDIEFGDTDVTSHPKDNRVGLSKNPRLVYGWCADRPVSSAEGYDAEKMASERGATRVLTGRSHHLPEETMSRTRQRAAMQFE